MQDPISRRRALRLIGTSLLGASCKPDALLQPIEALTLPGTASVTLIGTGDVHAAKANLAYKTGALVRNELAANPSAFAFALGDNAGVDGTRIEYGYYHNTPWGAVKARTLFLLGNHELRSDPTADGYYDYVNGDGIQRGPAGERGKGWYARTLGNWRCYFLNSEHSRSEQLDWLRADLLRYPGLHKMAMWHKPMFSSICAHSKGLMAVPAQVGPWWNLLQIHRAELVVVGHVHRYERFAPMLADGTRHPTLGIRQFNVGTGCGNLMAIARDADGTLRTHPGSVKQVVEPGVLKLVLHPDHYEWRFIDIYGHVRDRGGLACRLTGAGGWP